MTPAIKSGNLPSIDQNDQLQDDGNNSDVEGEEDDTTGTQSTIDTLNVESPPSSVLTSTLERPSSSASTSSITSRQQKGNRKRLCDVREERFLQIENKKLELLAQNLMHDEGKSESEELHFFKSLIPYMEKLSPIHRLKVRNKIQQVIIDELLFVENFKDVTTRQSTGDTDIGQCTPSNNNLTLTTENSSQSTSNPASLSFYQHPYSYQY